MEAQQDLALDGVDVLFGGEEGGAQRTELNLAARPLQQRQRPLDLGARKLQIATLDVRAGQERQGRRLMVAQPETDRQIAGLLPEGDRTLLLMEPLGNQSQVQKCQSPAARVALRRPDGERLLKILLGRCGLSQGEVGQTDVVDQKSDFLLLSRGAAPWKNGLEALQGFPKRAESPVRVTHVLATECFRRNVGNRVRQRDGPFEAVEGLVELSHRRIRQPEPVPRPRQALTILESDGQRERRLVVVERLLVLTLKPIGPSPTAQSIRLALAIADRPRQPQSLALKFHLLVEVSQVAQRDSQAVERLGMELHVPTRRDRVASRSVAFLGPAQVPQIPPKGPQIVEDECLLPRISQGSPQRGGAPEALDGGPPKGFFRRGREARALEPQGLRPHANAVFGSRLAERLNPNPVAP